MKLDLRIPLGLMFTIVGLILVIFGAVTNGSSLYARSAGMNINLIWGVAMLAFGITMFVLGWRASKRPKELTVTHPDVFPHGHGHGH